MISVDTDEYFVTNEKAMSEGALKEFVQQMFTPFTVRNDVTFVESSLGCRCVEDSLHERIERGNCSLYTTLLELFRRIFANTCNLWHQPRFRRQRKNHCTWEAKVNQNCRTFYLQDLLPWTSLACTNSPSSSGHFTHVTFIPAKRSYCTDIRRKFATVHGMSIAFSVPLVPF